MPKFITGKWDAWVRQTAAGFNIKGMNDTLNRYVYFLMQKNGIQVDMELTIFIFSCTQRSL
jgi:hypothetical protein